MFFIRFNFCRVVHMYLIIGLRTIFFPQYPYLFHCIGMTELSKGSSHLILRFLFTVHLQLCVSFQTVHLSCYEWEVKKELHIIFGGSAYISAEISCLSTWQSVFVSKREITALCRCRPRRVQDLFFPQDHRRCRKIRTLWQRWR